MANGTYGPMDRHDSLPTVSVIVPCHGALDHISDLIASLAAQDAAFQWEAVFIDNNLVPPERSRLAEAVRVLPDARIVDEREAGASPARNAGASAARGAVLAFIDADDVASTTWLRGLTAGVATGSIAAGRLDVVRLNPPWLARSRGVQPAEGEHLAEGIYPVAPSGNMAVTRQDFDRLGGFAWGTGALEDFDFSFRAWKLGIRIRRAGPEATVYYRLRHEPRALFRQGYQYGIGRARAYRTLVDHQLVNGRSFQGWRSWGRLALSAPLAPFRRSDRALSAWILGNRLGRLAGSVRYRVVYV